MKKEERNLSMAMLCGILGCLCYGGSDWLMVYGDPSHTGSLYWLTKGVAEIPAWRNGLAMFLAFPESFFMELRFFIWESLLCRRKNGRFIIT